MLCGKLLNQIFKNSILKFLLVKSFPLVVVPVSCVAVCDFKVQILVFFLNERLVCLLVELPLGVLSFVDSFVVSSVSLPVLVVTAI